MRWQELEEGAEYAYYRKARDRGSRTFDADDYTHVKVLKRRDEHEVPVSEYVPSRGTKTVTSVLVQVMTSNTGYGGLGRRGKKVHVGAVMLVARWSDHQAEAEAWKNQRAEWEREKAEREKRAAKVRGRLRRVGMRPGYGDTQYVYRDHWSGREFEFSVEAMEKLLDRAGVQ